MNFREATIHDIPQIQIVRNAVRENVLSNPNLVTDADCEEFITQRGKGWVSVVDNTVVGFAIADLKEHNIWALFILPEFEQKGIGKQLHTIMLNWYFEQTAIKVWLSTAFNTRAEQFYIKAGWQKVGLYGTKETKFEMTYEQWMKMKHN